MNDAYKIYGFFAGTGTDHAGRTIQDYLEMPNETLEQLHDYIQWAFPTREASQCQAPNAPLLSDEAVQLVRNDLKAMANYYAMWKRIIAFYEDTKHWLVDLDHNHLRITRIIHSSAEFFNVETAEMFVRIILKLNRDADSPINTKSIDFWLRAIDTQIARCDDPDYDIELGEDGFYVPK